MPYPVYLYGSCKRAGVSTQDKEHCLPPLSHGQLCFRISFLEEDEALQASPSQRAHTNSPKPPELMSPEVCLLQVPSA